MVKLSSAEVVEEGRVLIMMNKERKGKDHINKKNRLKNIRIWSTIFFLQNYEILLSFVYVTLEFCQYT